MEEMLRLYPHGRILILSGEGEEGGWYIFPGKRTARAIKSRLTRERCHGDRWARAYIHTGTNDEGQNMYMDMLNNSDVRYLDNL